MTRLIDEKDLAKQFGRRPPPCSDPSHPAWKNLLTGNAAGKCRLKKGESIGKESSVFWIVPKDEIGRNTITSDHKKMANPVRDFLGLVHHKRGTSLVVLNLSGAWIKGRRHARPIFADSGTHRRFKAVADLVRNRRRKGWGCTVDLSKLQKGEQSIDGSMERVVESIPANELHKIDYRVIGFVDNTMGLESLDDDLAFAQRLMVDRSKNDLKKELLALL